MLSLGHWCLWVITLAAQCNHTKETQSVKPVKASSCYFLGNTQTHLAVLYRLPGRYRQFIPVVLQYPFSQSNRPIGVNMSPHAGESALGVDVVVVTLLVVVVDVDSIYAVVIGASAVVEVDDSTAMVVVGAWPNASENNASILPSLGLGTAASGWVMQPAANKTAIKTA
jgi:hypothetical protein